MQIDNYIAVTKAKTELLDIIRHVDNKDDTIAITKNGIPKVVVMSMLQFEAMQETISILADDDLMRQVRSSINEIRERKTLVDLEDI